MIEPNSEVQTWLEDFVRAQGGAAGSVHLCQNGGLRLAASVNLPPKVQEIVAWVPSGKGMAGLALERGESVQTCNLQRDAGSGGRERVGAVRTTRTEDGHQRVPGDDPEDQEDDDGDPDEGPQGEERSPGEVFLHRSGPSLSAFSSGGR